MEESEVIDIDDLLGSATAGDAEEYDFENFSNEEDASADLVPSAVVTKAPLSGQAASQDGPTEGGRLGSGHRAKQAGKRSSLEGDLKKLFLPSKSSKKASRQGQVRPERAGHRQPAPAADPGLAAAHDDPNGGHTDARVAQNEALVDAFVQGEQSEAVLSEEELCIDVTSEELRQFILEFEAEAEAAGDPPVTVQAAPACGKQRRVVSSDHRHQSHRPPPPPSDDQDSLNSSLSAAESREGSQTSSDRSPARAARPRVPRGKSVRFLVSNLLRNNKANSHHHHQQHHRHSGVRTSGSEEDSKEPRRSQGKASRERGKRRDKEDRERERSGNKQRPKAAATSGAPPAAAKMPTGPDPLPAQAKTQPRQTAAGSQGQARSLPSAATIATPLSPGGRDNTLHKQLIQAASRGDQQVLEFLLAANEGLSQVRDNRGNTLLHAVARRGHLECVVWLAAGPCAGLLSVENDDCFTASALAIKHGQLECLKCLTRHPDGSAELRVRGHRWSLLHLAGRFGQQVCLRWLLEHMAAGGLAPDQTDHNGCSPVHLAAKYGHLYCLQTLVEFNADVTLLNKKRQSACTLATRYHQDACAQFLVVVETCVRLSAELTAAQRKQRECQQEKDALTKKLREALSCTDALVHMQKTDLAQRIEQLQGEYVDLTNLLVRQLDHMHRNQAHLAGGSAVTREDMLVSEQKAVQLQQTCSELLHQCQLQEPSPDRLAEIERRLSRLQPLPTSPIWPLASPQHNTDLALESMRARLSDVNQQISSLHQPSPSLHQPSPSLTADSLETLSLSSSYGSSLSSSTSSLQTGPGEQVSPSLGGQLAPKAQPAAAWGDEPSNNSCSSSSETDTSAVSGAEKGRDAPPPIPDPNAKAAATTLPPANLEDGGQSPVLSPRPRESGGRGGMMQLPINGFDIASNARGCSGEVSTKHSGLPVDSGSQEPADGARSPEPAGETPVAARHLSSPPSYEESCSRLTRNPPRFASSKSHSGDAVGQAAKHPNAAPNGGVESALPPSLRRGPPLGADVSPPYSAKPYYAQQQPQPQPKHCAQSLPCFMRKVQPTNEFGEAEADPVVVKISDCEEMVLQPSQQGGRGGGFEGRGGGGGGGGGCGTTTTTTKESSHRRAGSNSSASSLSSDLPWSESDPDESAGPPHPSGRPRRAGILLRKDRTDSASRRSQDRHITFALDTVDPEPGSAAPPLAGTQAGGASAPTATTAVAASAANPAGKRRDLSPIYEAPDLVKSTNDDGKAPSRTASTPAGKAGGEAPSPDPRPVGAPPGSSHPQSATRARNFRLFSYSSDEGDQDGPAGQTPQHRAPAKTHQESSSYPDGLTDVVSTEFNGIRGEGQDAGRCRREDVDEKLWYESSEEEEELQFHELPLASSPGYERHVCYL